MGPVGRIGLRVWDEILRCAQEDRLGKETRHRQELERGRRTRKKQVPPAVRRARNDNSLGPGALVMKLA
jgi:hypothetical protein